MLGRFSLKVYCVYLFHVTDTHDHCTSHRHSGRYRAGYTLGKPHFATWNTRYLSTNTNSSSFVVVVWTDTRWAMCSSRKFIYPIGRAPKSWPYLSKETSGQVLLSPPDFEGLFLRGQCDNNNDDDDNNNNNNKHLVHITLVRLATFHLSSSTCRPAKVVEKPDLRMK